MNILSIDWDWLMDCTDLERFLMFPDGGNEGISMELSLFIWQSNYVSGKCRKAYTKNGKELLDIGIKEEEFSIIKKSIFDNSDYLFRLQLADSHQEIYHLVKSCFETPEPILNVYNVDHHSDCYNLGTELNCGNWLNKLDAEGYLSSLTWIKNDADGTIEKDTLNCEVIETKDINVISDIEWDIIFICRSSVWTPPHLDKRFNEFYEFFSSLELGLTLIRQEFSHPLRWRDELPTKLLHMLI